jgi:hypothetical protein
MLKKILLILAALGTLAVGLLVLNYQRAEESRTKWANAEAKLNANATRARETCETAVARAVAPASVLDFPYEEGNGFNSTDTGFSYVLVADTGDSKSRVKCFMSREFVILRLAQQ